MTGQDHRRGAAEIAGSSAGRPNVIPLYRTFAADTLTPVAITLASQRAGEQGFLFESVTGGRHVARFSIIGIAPRERLTAGADGICWRRGALVERLAESFPLALKRLLARHRPAPEPALPRFTGGYVGYLGYNCAAMVERLPVKPDPFGLPDAALYRFDDLIVYDHVTSRVLTVANACLDEHPTELAARADAASRLDRLADLLATARADPVPLPDPAATPVDAGLRPNFESAVRRAQDEIRAGQVFQVVLSIQQRLPVAARPFDVYRRLRMSNPSPYHFYLDMDGTVILGASPEMLVRVEATAPNHDVRSAEVAGGAGTAAAGTNGRSGRVIEIRPIAGTRPRGATAASDLALREELLADPKENAEHVMLVDLGRNDVGRVAEFGSVQVASFRQIELYSHVMHMVSSVTGRLRHDQHPVDAFFACFPAGTVTGAPKIRAMEIIDELEPVGRGVYSGAVGYFDYRGNVDTCIAIRTIVIRDGVAQVQGGAGIVADSDPALEFAECGHKTAALRAALGSPARPAAREVAS